MEKGARPSALSVSSDTADKPCRGLATGFRTKIVVLFLPEPVPPDVRGFVRSHVLRADLFSGRDPDLGSHLPQSGSMHQILFHICRGAC
jgi:hypothetical protein